jgi:hypothetical protein
VCRRVEDLFKAHLNNHIEVRILRASVRRFCSVPVAAPCGFAWLSACSRSDSVPPPAACTCSADGANFHCLACFDQDYNERRIEKKLNPIVFRLTAVKKARLPLAFSDLVCLICAHCLPFSVG